MPSHLQDSAPRAHAEVVGGFVRLRISTPPWRWSFAVDSDPATGVLRDLAHVMSQTTGARYDALLSMLVEAISYQRPALRVLS